MKKTLLLIAGGIALIALFGSWMYLLFFGAPASVDDVFVDFGFAPESPQPLPPETVNNGATNAETQTVDVSGTLTQLTVRPVAGATMVFNATSTSKIYYAERGTGHVYTIDAANGNEERVSGTTYTGINEAVFAPDATSVILIARDAYEETAYLSPLTDSASLPVFPANAENIAYKNTATIAYTTIDETGTTGATLDLQTGEVRQRFTLPFQDIDVVWFEDEEYIVSKPAPHHRGALFKISSGGAPTRVHEAYNLLITAHPENPDIFVRTEVNHQTDTLTSYVGERPLPLVVIPEKCAYGTNTTTLYCAAPFVDENERTAVSNWYKGLNSSNDVLWEVNTEEGSATLLADLEAETGRRIDVTNTYMAADGSTLLFQNKIDNTLWRYQLSLNENEGSKIAVPLESATTTATSSEADL